MKLLILSNLYPPYYLGGYEILCRQVAQNLKGRGHEVSVLTSQHGIQPQSQMEDGIQIHRLLELDIPFDQPGRIKRTRRWKVGRKNYQVTRQILDSENPDLVFIWSQLRMTLGSAKAVEQSGCPVAYTMNDPHIFSYQPAVWGRRPGQWWHYLTDRSFFKNTTYSSLKLQNITCISHALKEELLELGVPVNHAQVIHQGIPLDAFPLKDEPGLLHKPLRLLFAGQLQPYKGVHTVLEALSQLEQKYGDNRFQLTIAGAGSSSYEAELKQKARSLSKVEFCGRVQQEELAGIYRNHDILLFPSIWREPFGLVHLEAMASGTPVISTTVGGPAEFLVHENNALTFEAGDAQALARAIRRIQEEPGLARRLAIQARKSVEQDFSLDSYVNRLEVFLQRAGQNPLQHSRQGA